jgi:hypothetical protein
MSDSPCTGCRSTRHGRLFYAYVNHFMGTDMERRRVRLCQQCVFDLLGPLLEGADHQEDGQWRSIEEHTAAASETSSAKPVPIQHARRAAV